MSDTFSSSAPPDAPVGEGQEVDTANGSGEELIPASRFNGLMASFNRAQNEHQQEVARLRQELENLRAQVNSEPSVGEGEEDLATIQDEVRQMLALMEQERQAAARAKAEALVLSKHPQLAAFVDLLPNTNAEEFVAVAEALASRLEGLKGNADSQPPAAPPTTPQPTDQGSPPPPPAPVMPGGATFDSAGSLEDQIRDALKNRDMDRWMQLKAQQAAERGGD